MPGGMVESPTEKNKSRSFRDAKSLGLINKGGINSQEQSLRQPEREYLQKQISNGYFLISSCNLYDVTWKKNVGSWYGRN